VRTIRYSERWEACRAELAGAVPRLEEAEQGVEWAVALAAETYAKRFWVRPGRSL